MLKMLAVSFALASTPVCVVLATPQDPPSPGSAPIGAFAAPDVDAELTALRDDLRAARADLAAARHELDECLDMLDQEAVRPQRHDCTPSRSLLTYYQWLDRHGHGDRAERALDRIVDDHRRDGARLGNLARELMTEQETAGKFDRAALALVRRMFAAGSRSHRQLDTAALAFFLNGDVDEAVRLQRQALAQQKNSDEYRRRLLTYEAGQRLAPAAKAAEPAAKIARAE
ncbi:MAG: hypothetical protein R3F56_19195 [Planctomycetota bacterium]